MSKGNNLIYGFGIFDMGYTVAKYEQRPDLPRDKRGKIRRKMIWYCRYYSKWLDMLKRCYSPAYHDKKPTYKDCYVCEEWKYFSNFRKWMEGQDWEGLQLDKDALVTGNKIYSPETCVFVTKQVNVFLLESDGSRGEYPIGVNWCNTKERFIAQCQNPFSLKRDYLGSFACPHEAHKAWLSKKLEHAYALAAIQTDPRVAKALIERYENYVPDVAVKEKVT